MPKLVFKKMSLFDNIDFIKSIFSERNEFLDIYTYTTQLFPELADISNEDDINKKIEMVVTKYYNEKSSDIDNDVLRYNEVWKTYNDEFFKAISTYLNIEWPSSHDTIIVNVGIIPVCPRYLDDFSFSVHDGINDDFLVETCAHELCHFLWFEKWKELYPECPKEEYESPYPAWEYSEMVVDPILNSADVSIVFDNKKIRYCYDSFYDTNPGLMNKLFDIYGSNISIEDRIKKGYELLINSKKR